MTNSNTLQQIAKAAGGTYLPKQTIKTASGTSYEIGNMIRIRLDKGWKKLMKDLTDNGFEYKSIGDGPYIKFYIAS